MYIRDVLSNRFLIIAILFILLLIMVFVMSRESVYPKVYLSETVSVVGRFIETFISFLKK